MYIFAYVCLLVGLLASLGCGGMALMRLWRGRSDQLSFLGHGNIVISACLALASALLLHALFWEDYRLDYVASYTDSFLPVFYRLTAFWAGQPGSMLFWGLVCALCGSLFAATGARHLRSPQTILWFWAFFYANMAFFCLVLTCWSNPFIMTRTVPADGSGLNPLLQNPGMILHPPLLFIGYAGFTVPACLALAQLLSPDRDDPPWHQLTRPYILLSWVFLTAGIALGAWWAYMELGWGGYWGWDPVENASLVPWLIATAGMHTIALTNNSGKLPRMSAALIALSVVGAFFATYLTRSGVIQSVHAFGDGGVGTPLLVFVAASFFIVLYAAIFFPAPEKPLSSLLSREGAIVFTAWIFLALAIIIILATTWPVLTALAGAVSRGLDASFYNRVCLPPAALLLLLLCVCGFIGWTNGLARHRAGIKLCIVGGIFLASAAVIWFTGYEKPLPLVSASAAFAIMTAVILKAIQPGFWKDKRLVSAAGAHLGIAVIAFGVAFSGAYTVEKDMVFSKGQKESFGPYTVALQDVGDGAGHGYDYLRATLTISRGNVEVGTVAPERRIYQKFGAMQFSEVDVITSLKEDIYASLLGMDAEYRVLVKMSLEPMVNWIWIGGALICLLPLLGLGRFKNAAKKSAKARA